MRKMKESGIKWIGEIPRDWDVVPFYSYLDNANNSIVDGPFGSDMKNEEYVDDGVPVIQLGSIKEYQMDFSKMHYVTNEKADDLIRHNAKPGDIAIAKMMPAGKACEIPNDYPRYVVSADVIKASISNLYKRKYVIYALNVCATVQAEIEAQGSTRSRINISKAKRFMIPRPLNDDFKIISSFLDLKCSEIDSLTSDIQTQLDTLEQYKRSVITEAVTRGLDKNVEMKESGIEYVGKIPASWDMHPVYYYFGERKHKNSLGEEQNLLSLSYGNIIRKDINTREGLLPESFNTYNIVEAGDIIIRPTDLQNDKRSLRTGLVREHGIITSAYIDLMPVRNINTEYYHYLLHAFDVMKVFYNMGNGVRQGLNFSEFSRLMVFEPSLAEQNSIVDYLNDKCGQINTVISEKQDQLATLDSYKKSLIYEYVTGKKEVPAV